MNNVHILTTSGFILPNNPHYTVLTKEKMADVSIFNRTALVSTDSNVAQMVDTNQIYHSDIANEAYKKFEASGKFEDFMAMIDIATDVLSKVNYDTFFELQANNRHISAFSIKLCNELLNGNFVRNYHEYATIPFNIRFTADNGLTSSQAADRVKAMRYSKTYYLNTWQNLLSMLANDRSAFSTFFKYVFVDSY